MDEQRKPESREDETLPKLHKTLNIYRYLFIFHITLLEINNVVPFQERKKIIMLLI